LVLNRYVVKALTEVSVSNPLNGIKPVFSPRQRPFPHGHISPCLPFAVAQELFLWLGDSHLDMPEPDRHSEIQSEVCQLLRSPFPSLHREMKSILLFDAQIPDMQKKALHPESIRTKVSSYVCPDAGLSRWDEHPAGETSLEPVARRRSVVQKHPQPDRRPAGRGF
jgi:hypothetical protein